MDIARYIGAVCRLCRREGQKLFLKGDRCYTEKCGVQRKPNVPGQHGQMRRKMSEYGVQFREKQKTRRYYGILESQFERYFGMANKSKGITGERLLQILELRLDNAVYRLGFARSRAQARQLVSHGHFRVNDKKVNIPSYLLRDGDRVSLKEKSRSCELFKSLLEVTHTLPDWLSRDEGGFQGLVLRLPSMESVDLEVKVHLIVELYSK